MPPSEPKTQRGLVRLLLMAAGIAFLAGALLNNEWLVALVVRGGRVVFHRAGIAIPEAHRTRLAQLAFLCAAAVAFAAAWVIARMPALDRWLRRPAVERLALAVFAIAVPLLCMELSLRPFVPPHEATTRIFEPDDRLGWRLRPGVTDRWGGVEVHVNERGFRGPVVPYARRPHTRRVLYLGDSVTFGYRIARWQGTFPFVVGSVLASRDSVPTETVNLSVEGYSPWQEYRVMADEGQKYDPDLVVVGFVLNDVTEMFHLTRFGGTEVGFQMQHAYASRLVRVLSHSAVFYELQNLSREIEARRRLGRDVRLGAIQREMLEVETLMHHPDQPNVKTAWDIALADLQKIVDLCGNRRIPVLVVVLPYASQLSDPAGLSAPQRVITSYARARGIHTLDLLPLMADYARANGATPTDLFLDQDHLTERGHRVVAGMMAGTVAAMAQAR